MKYIFLLIVLTFAACTYSISMVHTEGEAQDVIDAEQTANPVVSPTVTTP